MKTITKIKMRRFINRRSNGVVEQLEKLVAKLQTWIAKLDAEQDAANQAMKQEIAAIKKLQLSRNCSYQEWCRNRS